MKNPSSYTKLSSLRSARITGFTLVEVLTVIAIISILMTAGAIGLGNLTAGKGTASAIATAESLFDEARTIAVSKRCAARVLVDINAPASDNYLRRIVIARQKINPDGSVASPVAWILSSRGYTMPRGTFFSKKYSKQGDGTSIPTQNMTMTNETGGTMSAYSGNYASFEFNSEGIISSPGTKFVIGSGVRPRNGEPQIASGAELDFAGFVIWRNGSTSAYRSPSQMNISSIEKDF